MSRYKLDAISREADEEPWEFEFDGEVYQLPSDLDMRAAAALTGGRFDEGLQILLGPEQWRRICASPLVFGTRQLVDLLNTYCADIGVELGEFVASSSSSKSTPTPSKRTSNGSTKSRSRTSSRAGSRGAD